MAKLPAQKMYPQSDYVVVRVFIDPEPNEVAWWEITSNGQVIEQLRDGSAPYIRSLKAEVWLAVVEKDLLEIEPKARFML